MAGGDGEEVDIGGGAGLVVVADLEVARGGVERVGAEGLGRVAVQADLEDVVLVRDGVAELGAQGHGADRGADLVAAGPGLLDAELDEAVAVDEQLGDGLAADAVVDVDLADDGAVAALDDQGGGQLVHRRVGVPAGRARLSQLGAAEVAVGRGHAPGRGRVAGNLHHQGAIAALGEEAIGAMVSHTIPFEIGLVRLPCNILLVVLPAATALQLRGGNGGGIARAANGELEAELAEVEVTTRGTARVQGRGGRGEGGSRQNDLGEAGHLELLEVDERETRRVFGKM